jgi:hypothetical protein
MIAAAAAAIAFAPISMFTMAPAHADYPACGTGSGTGYQVCEQMCASGQSSPAFCNQSPAGVPATGCVGSANDCGNRIARCAAGTGPCPY